jgi:NADPH:quinone reductase-like Zn-dependent oxidoreductase
VRAVRLYENGLRLETVETPVATAGEVLVKVCAAAITRGELAWPADRLPAVPSYEVSGEDVQTGQEVFGLLPFDRDGAAAEYVTAPASVLAPKPSRLTHIEAAALPMAALTAWQGLILHGHLHRGNRVHITGESGGVGHVAAQLARHLGVASVATGPADLVFDTAGEQTPCAARVVTIARPLPGATYFVVEPNGRQLTWISNLAEAGELEPMIDSTFPLDRAAAAFDRVAAHGKHGKVVFDVAG